MKNKMRFKSKSLGLAPTWQNLCTITFIAFTAGQAMAQDTWDGGGGDGLWSNGTNWLDNTAPAGSTGNLVFAGNTQNLTNNDIAGLSTGAVNFTNNGGAGVSNAFTLAGNTVTLGGNISMTLASAAITDVISLGLILNANRSVATNANHNLTISGIISETGTPRNLTKGGGANLTLSNSANSFTGQVIADNGTISVTGIADAGVASAMGAGSSFRIGTGNNTPTLAFTAGAASTNRQLQIGAGNTGIGGSRLNNNTANGSGALIFTNANFNILDATAGISAGRNLLLGGSNTDANAINGIIADNTATSKINVVKDGLSSWTLGGTNAYTGVTNVNAGRLIVNGNISTSSLTTVGTAGTLAGNGTLGKTIVNGNLTVGNSPGQMNFTDTLSLAGTITMEIDGTSGAGVTGGHDFVNLTGSGATGQLTYGGTMTIDIGAIFGAGVYSWNLFDMVSETGTFTTITLADQYSGSLLDTDLNDVWDLTSGINTWQFTQSTGVLDLIVIPEPNTAILLGSLGVLALARRRRA